MMNFFLALLSIILLGQSVISTSKAPESSKVLADHYSDIPSAVIVNQVLGFLDCAEQAQLVSKKSHAEVAEFSFRALKTIYPQMETLFYDSEGKLMAAKIARFTQYILPRVKPFYSTEGYRRLGDPLLVLTLVLIDFVTFTPQIRNICHLLYALFDGSGVLPGPTLERLRAGLLSPWRSSLLLYRLITDGSDDGKCAALLLKNNLEPDVYSHTLNQDFATMSQLAASNGSIRILGELIRHGAD